MVGVLEEDLRNFAERVGVQLKDIAFMEDICSVVRERVLDNFNPSGTKDGSVIGRLRGYVCSLLRSYCQPIPPSLRHPAHSTEKGAPRRPVNGHHETHQEEEAHAAGEEEHFEETPGDDGFPPEEHEAPEGAEVHAFVEQLNLGPHIADFLASLPQEMQEKVLGDFDATGTKDGKVEGRLIGYVRGFWARSLGINDAAFSVLRGLPDDVQMKVISEFKPGGSKDGNISARLLQFMERKDTRAAAPRSTKITLVPVDQVPYYPLLQSGGTLPSSPRRSGPPAVPGSVAVDRLARTLRLDRSMTDFLLSLPDDVQRELTENFDPSGTKDGYVEGRLFAYVRRLVAKKAGWDPRAVDELKRLPEEEQRHRMRKWLWDHAPRASSHRGRVASPPRDSAAARHPRWKRHVPRLDPIQAFVEQWRLDTRIAQFMEALPETVRETVISGFDGSGTKDGNVWGRLLGFARVQWARYWRLDAESIALVKALPEDVQMMCLTDFDASSSHDHDHRERLRAFTKRTMRKAGHAMRPRSPPRVHVPVPVAEPVARRPREPVREDAQSASELLKDPAVNEFMGRCDLDPAEVLPLLESLSEELLFEVMENFDPSSTRDGNVLGRLRGYVNGLARRGQLPDHRGRKRRRVG